MELRPRQAVTTLDVVVVPPLQRRFDAPGEVSEDVVDEPAVHHATAQVGRVDDVLRPDVGTHRGAQQADGVVGRPRQGGQVDDRVPPGDCW